MEPLQFGLTNSELAVVESIQAEAKAIFKKQFAAIESRTEYYTNLQAISRFSIARQFNKQKTLQMWRNWIKWYESFRPDQISPSEEIITKIHTSGKYRYVGVDKEGCPILLIRMRYHIKGLATVQENFRYLIFMIEEGVRLAHQSKTYKISVIFDRRNLAESDQVSSQSMKKFMPILNDCYPETLKAFYVLGANWFYRAMWSVVKIFVSKRTEDKIHLLPEVEDLQKFIPVCSLATEYGGPLKIEDSIRVIPIHPETDVEDKEQLDKIKKQWT